MALGPAQPPLEWLDEVASRFEEAWQGDTLPSIAPFVADAPSEHRGDLLQELIILDMEFRAKRKCPRPLEEYLEEFPELHGPGQAPPLKLVEHDQKLRAADGKNNQHHQAGATPPAAAATLPAFIGKYQVLGPLDAGGQADVFLAYHPHLRKEVVIKLGQGKYLDAAEQQQIIAEGRILASLDDANLAKVYDLDFHEGRAFLVLEFVRGGTLAQYARERKPAPREAARLVAQVARALEAIHVKGITHQDLKPKNILIDDHGQPRLIDFGLARHRSAWLDEARQPLGGTVAFMAPEQAAGAPDKVGPPTDVFALGATLYFLLTGNAPFAAEDRQSAMAKVERCDFDRAALAKSPRGLRKICLRAMAPEAERRPQPLKVARDLERFILWRRLRLVFLAWAFVAATAFAIWFLWPKSQVDPPFVVQVWRNEKSADLASGVPLRAGDRLKLRLQIPANMHAALFLVNGQGRLHHVESVPPRPEPHDFHKTFEVAGDPGTEFVLACLRHSAPINADEVKSLWDNSARWDPLPPQTILRVVSAEVKEEQEGRDLLPVDVRADPQTEIKNRLERFRQELRGRFDHVLGLAFAHQNLPE